MKEYSLCTYTFNDHDLLADFLDSINSWSILPKEIIIVDDKSESLFQHPKLKTLPITYIYNEKNIGPTRTKETGINHTTCRHILSCDCDVRIGIRWVEKIYEILDADQTVGMCSSSIDYDCGNDSISRYLNKFCSTHSHGYVDFIAGPVWMISASAWKHIGGWQNFQLSTHEDIELCNRLKKSGYNLYSTVDVAAKHIRAIRRIDVVKRHWQWTSGLYPEDHTKINKEFEIDTLIGNSNKRIQISLSSNEPLFVYIEILYIAHAVLSLLRSSKSFEEADYFLSTLFAKANKHKKVKYKLANDLKEIGHTLDTLPDGCYEYWNGKLKIIDRLNESGVMSWINNHGLSIIDQEDIRVKKDFSFHSIIKKAGSI